MIRKTWKEHLKVDSKIVRLLSAATYEDFPSALRELVSNAYDADATRVDITVDIENDFIKIRDDGNGMTPEEFSFFLRIAGQHRGRKTSPNFGRERIGQFGIGFLAVFPFGKKITISSTVRRSEMKFEATIPAEKYFDGKGLINVEDIPIPGIETQDKKYFNEHGVTIKISPLTEMVHRYFQPMAPSPKRRHANSIRDFLPLERLKWTLSEDLPIKYEEGSIYGKEFSDLELSSLTVRLNGTKLRRNSPGRNVLETDTWNFDDIECRYLIATDWKSILPNEERGLKLRLKNVGIGSREQFGLQTEGRTYSRLHWLSGEIHILKGFDNLLSIDRAKFVDSLDYDEFRKFFRGRLATFANQVELVAVAKRDIERQINESRLGEVGPRRELIDRNIERLKEKGFAVRTKSRSSSDAEDSPVTIDLDERVIEIFKDDDLSEDIISIGSERLEIRYKKWNQQEDGRVARRNGEGIIEVNLNYALFKSRKYGDVFLRVLVILLLSAEQSKSRSQMQSDFATLLLSEFGDLSGL